MQTARIGNREMCRGLLPPVQDLAVGTTVPPGELSSAPKDRTEGIVDDTGNSDTCANRRSDVLDDKRCSLRCRRHSCSDIARIKREFRLLDLGSRWNELHFGAANRVVDGP